MSEALGQGRAHQNINIPWSETTERTKDTKDTEKKGRDLFTADDAEDSDSADGSGMNPRPSAQSAVSSDRG